MFPRIFEFDLILLELQLKFLMIFNANKRLSILFRYAFD